ncbi:MAG TPA: M56 family metallopeptidase [Candidatus Limnocylindrales bacterium]|nr:M56 family metallopeptidase [Candidatus Limnocylindrales bacterium]
MIAAVVNHIWQSTLFACMTGLRVLILRKNHAAVRHGLWLAASVKFLVPFSLLVGLGSQLEWRKTPEPRPAAVLQISDPIAIAVWPADALRQAPSRIPAILFGVWLCGFAANCLACWRRWRQVRAAWREASPMHLNLPIPVLASSSRLEPGVFGVFRPVLLLPDGLREHLTQEQLEAIVAHELCHVKRRDNLSSAIHMLVEALFWFDPVVWWIRARLIEERERACDEAVLGMGSDPQSYAQGIVTVCKFYLKSPLVCVPGVTGSDLQRRVETIMLNRAAEDMNRARKLLLAAAGAVAVTAPLIIGVNNAPSVRAQEPAKPLPQLVATSSLPEFEVASIKGSAPDGNLKVDFAPGGKLYITNATLRFLIKIAYDIGDDQLAGGPGWIGSKRFDLAATPDRPLAGDPKNMAPDQILVFHKPTRLRLQRLLAERFQLELRRDSTPMPIFALVIAKGGPKKLTPTKSTGDPRLNAKFRSGILNAVGVDMNTLAHFLSEGQTGRPVVDMTGLEGKFDFNLEWTPDPSLNPLPPDSTANQQPSDGGGVSIFTAVQQQLGLKLEGRTDAADRLVVVRAELPSSN